MSGGALRLVLAPGPTGRTVAVEVPAAPDPAAGWGDALQAQRVANAATARVLSRGRLLLAILTGDLPRSGESWPPKA